MREAAKPEPVAGEPVITAPVQLALKPAEGDKATYRVIRQRKRSVEFEGPSAAATTGGHNDQKIEMTFVQQVESVDDKGNSKVKITIEALKYLSMIRDSVTLDFDSSSPEDQDSALARLIGQHYTIEILPTGRVARLLDAEDALAVVKGKSQADRAALKVLSLESINELHGTLTLPQLHNKLLDIGDSYSDVKFFSFDFMGSKTFERVYTLKEIKDIKGRHLAAVQMKGVPSLKVPEPPEAELPGDDFARIFNNTATYSGQLTFDLTAGKVQEYSEELTSEWIAVDPEAQEKGRQPDVLTMRAVRFYKVQRLD